MAYGLTQAGCDVTVLERGPDDTWQGSFNLGAGEIPYELWNWELAWAYQANIPCSSPVKKSPLHEGGPV